MQTPVPCTHADAVQLGAGRYNITCAAGSQGGTAREYLAQHLHVLLPQPLVGGEQLGHVELKLRQHRRRPFLTRTARLGRAVCDAGLPPRLRWRRHTARVFRVDIIARRWTAAVAERRCRAGLRTHELRGL